MVILADSLRLIWSIQEIPHTSGNPTPIYYYYYKPRPNESELIQRSSVIIIGPKNKVKKYGETEG